MKQALSNALLVGAGGFAGALSRYFLGGWVQRALGPTFPYGTLIVNLVGALALGFLMEWLALAANWSSHVRLVVAIGFLGSFTTFSTLAYESLQLGAQDRPVALLVNAFGSVALGLVVAWLGMMAGRAILNS